jgi:prepilin-type N-terminal cleavage/methylation domain-containing protein
MNRRFYSTGFTLMELSVVLVIISMLIGGVLAGRELIQAATIRATIKQYEEFNTATQTFRVKFDCLPGDCTHVSDMGFDAGSAGNGDGMVGECADLTLLFVPCAYGYNGGTTYKEYFYFWYHLSSAGLIRDLIAYNASPALADSNFIPLGVETPLVKARAVVGISPYPDITKSGWGIQNEIIFTAAGGGDTIYSHAFVMGSAVLVGAGGVTIGSHSNMGGFTPWTLYAIDSKLDDGLPLSGQVRIWQGMTMSDGSGLKKFTLAGAGAAGGAFCVNTDVTPNVYNVQYQGTNFNGLCNIMILAGF